jgi:hypothetical protein
MFFFCFIVHSTRDKRFGAVYANLILSLSHPIRYISQKIPIKQLSGTMLEVEAEPTDTIGALKGKIQAANADLAAERQKLIYKGMVLKDTEIVGDLDIASNPDAYMVCMLAKVKAAKPAAAAAAPAATAAAAPANTVEASAAGTSATAPAPAPAPVAAPAPAPAAAPAAQQEYVFVFRYSIVLPSFLVHDGLYVSLIHLLLLACTL